MSQVSRHRPFGQVIQTHHIKLDMGTKTRDMRLNPNTRTLQTKNHSIHALSTDTIFLKFN
jgi:hypothetical protein